MTSRLRVQILNLGEQPFLYFDDLSTPSEEIDRIILEKYGKLSKNYKFVWTSEIVKTEDKFLDVKIEKSRWEERFSDERAENISLRRKVRSLEAKAKQALARQYFLEQFFTKRKISGGIDWTKHKPAIEYYERAMKEIGKIESEEK